MRILLICLLVVVCASCSKSKTNQTAENAGTYPLVIEEQKAAVAKLLRAAPIIDGDDESYWAYGMADSILGTINSDEKSLFVNQSKIYSAMTYIFYGMSYTKTIFAMCNKKDVSLEELSGIIKKPVEGTEDNDSLVMASALLEKDVVDACYFFCKVLGMNSVNDFKKQIKWHENGRESVIASQPQCAGKFVPLNNKKLFYKTFFLLIIGFDSMAYSGQHKKKLHEQLMPFAYEQDSIDDSDVQKLDGMPEKEYFENLKKGIHMQSVLITKFADEISKLKRNESFFDDKS